MEETVQTQLNKTVKIVKSQSKIILYFFVGLFVIAVTVIVFLIFTKNQLQNDKQTLVTNNDTSLISESVSQSNLRSSDTIIENELLAVLNEPGPGSNIFYQKIEEMFVSVIDPNFALVFYHNCRIEDNYCADLIPAFFKKIDEEWLLYNSQNDYLDMDCKNMMNHVDGSDNISLVGVPRDLFQLFNNPVTGFNSELCN